MKYQKFDETDSPTTSNAPQSRNYKHEFTELSQINSGYISKVYKSISKQNSEVFAIKKIPIEEDSAKTMLKDLSIIKNLNNQRVISYKSFWIEANYLLENESHSNNFQSRKSRRSDRRSNVNLPLLIHIQMEFCYSSLEQMVKVINDELN
jgi:hypothetical protein